MIKDSGPYKSGMLLVKNGADDFNGPFECNDGDAYLIHSCDDWLIGGPDEVRTLIVDLEAYLARRREQPLP